MRPAVSRPETGNSRRRRPASSMPNPQRFIKRKLCRLRFVVSHLKERRSVLNLPILHMFQEIQCQRPPKPAAAFVRCNRKGQHFRLGSAKLRPNRKP